MSNKKQFVVFGLGRFGLSVAKTLAEKGYEVMGVDYDKEAAQDASEYLTHVVCIDTTDVNAIKALGISNFDVAIVGIGDNIESSVLTTLMAKELGIKYILAKARNESHKKILERIGADRVVFPEREMGTRIANSLIYSNFFEFIELSDEFGIAEIEPIPQWIKKTLAQCDIRAKYGLNVVALKNEKKVQAALGADTIIEESDKLVVIGSSKQIQKYISKNNMVIF